jgi:GINS complex subunit 2
MMWYTNKERRKISASKEQARRERESDERENGYPSTADDDEDML